MVYKKIKKVLKVHPEKIKHKISNKGGKSVKGIEIVVPKPKETEKQPEKAKEAEKKPEKAAEKKPKKAKEAEKKPEKAKEAEKKPNPRPPTIAPVTAFRIGEWHDGGYAGPSYPGSPMEYCGYDSWGGNVYPPVPEKLKLPEKPKDGVEKPGVAPNPPQ